ncbi:MAG: molecular chaperone HtpG [Verrucomicrobiia bacterium]
MSAPETHSFQAEVQQLLNIVIHSLYTDREIFVRELISNAADALEKLRFHQKSGLPLADDSLELTISIRTDPSRPAITFTDTGIGMNRDELLQNLGTIAHSGSKQFLRHLAEANQNDLNLIGQFGVGFYSAFMVAQSVSVYSRSYRPEDSGWLWESDGSGTFTITPETGLRRGTRIVLHLKDDFKNLADPDTLRRIIRRYSNFVPFPITLNDERINTIGAIWTRNKTEVTADEYDQFYKFISHDFDSPRYHLHFASDAPLDLRALLFVPKQNLEKLGFTRLEPQVALHCKKVLIQPKAPGLLPDWLRFLRGVVDSEDLPLNISRESMQDSALIQKLNKVLTSRFLKFLTEEATRDPDTYHTFYSEFGLCLKEGVATDSTHRVALAKLLRFPSSHTAPGQLTSLADYLTRMPAEQKNIYFLVAPSRDEALASPYYEVFAHRHLEVLFPEEPWDEVILERLGSFEGKTILPAEKADLELPDPSSSTPPLSDQDARLVANFIKESLGDRVDEVRLARRLTESPAILAESASGLTASMRRMLKSMKRDPDQALPPLKPHLDINPAHPLIHALSRARTEQPEIATTLAQQLYDQALLSAGLLDQPTAMVRRLNTLMTQLLQKTDPST